MAEYINVEELVNAFIHNEIDNKGQTVGEVIDSLPTIDIPDTGIEFETPREQLAFICGAILEKQKRNGERRTE